MVNANEVITQYNKALKEHGLGTSSINDFFVELGGVAVETAKDTVYDLRSGKTNVNYSFEHSEKGVRRGNFISQLIAIPTDDGNVILLNPQAKFNPFNTSLYESIFENFNAQELGNGTFQINNPLICDNNLSNGVISSNIITNNIPIIEKTISPPPPPRILHLQKAL